jgi:hypothetical protein
VPNCTLRRPFVGGVTPYEGQNCSLGLAILRVCIASHTEHLSVCYMGVETVSPSLQQGSAPLGGSCVLPRCRRLGATDRNFRLNAPRKCMCAMAIGRAMLDRSLGFIGCCAPPELLAKYGLGPEGCKVKWGPPESV